MIKSPSFQFAVDTAYLSLSSKLLKQMIKQFPFCNSFAQNETWAECEKWMQEAVLIYLAYYPNY